MPSHKAGPPTLPNDADVELHGPLRQKLFNVDQGSNRDDYSGVHPNEDEWEIVTERYVMHAIVVLYSLELTLI